VFVHDADAASGVDKKENGKVMDLLLDLLPCRFSGGFTTNDRVYDWIDKGASVVVVEQSVSNTKKHKYTDVRVILYIYLYILVYIYLYLLVFSHYPTLYYSQLKQRCTKKT